MVIKKRFIIERICPHAAKKIARMPVYPHFGNHIIF